MTNKRVVVTGMSALTPIGLTVESFWGAMMNGESGCDFIKQFDTSKLETKFACELKGYDSANGPVCSIRHGSS
jgi:3-oxoacyl-[acyl-carrier-protein] synthase II